MTRASVNAQNLTRYVVGFVGGKKDERRRDLLRRAVTTERKTSRTPEPWLREPWFPVAAATGKVLSASNLVTTPVFLG